MGAAFTVLGIDGVLNNAGNILAQPATEIDKAPVYDTHPCVGCCAATVACVCTMFFAYGLLVGFQLLLGGIF